MLGEAPPDVGGRFQAGDEVFGRLGEWCRGLAAAPEGQQRHERANFQRSTSLSSPVDRLIEGYESSAESVNGDAITVPSHRGAEEITRAGFARTRNSRLGA